jgi:hypothetical protein
MAWNTGTIEFATHWPPNMLLLPELGWRPGGSVATNMPLLRSCFAPALFDRKQQGTKFGQQAIPLAPLKRGSPFGTEPVPAGDGPGGVRPSPGAAMLESDGALMKSDASASSVLAVPEDGHISDNITVRRRWPLPFSQE